MSAAGSEGEASGGIAPGVVRASWAAGAIYSIGFLTIVNAFNFFDRTLLSLVLPQIKHDLHLSDTALGLVSGLAFVLFYSSLGVPIARLADRTNRRNVIGLGFAVWSAMTLLMGLVSNVWQLALLRFAMGAGEAAGVAPSNSMVSDLVSPEQRPLGVSLVTAGSSLGSIVLLPLAGLVAQHWGWRATFMAAGAPGLLLSLLFLLSVREPGRGRAHTLAAEPAAGTVGRTLRFLASSRTYALIILSGCFMGVTIYADLVWIPTFMVRVHHFTVVQLGAVVGPIRGVLGLAGVVFGGVATVRLSRRDPRWQIWMPAVASLLIAPAGCLLLLAPGVGMSLVGLGLASFCNGMYSGLLFSACMAVVGPRMRAMASALFLLFGGTIGQIVGPALVGVLNDRLAPIYGPMAVRHSLLIAPACAVVAALLLASAAVHFRQDSARAERTLIEG